MKKKKIIRAIFILVFIILLLFAFKGEIIKTLFKAGIVKGDTIDPELLDIQENINMPELCGEYNVGRCKIDINDYSRYEIFSSKECDDVYRKICITIYYPTEENLAPSQYISDKFQKASRKYAVNNIGEYPLKYIIPNCTDNAEIADTDAGFPVLLFSPGGSLQTEYYSYIFESLASSGYIVIAIPEMYSTPIVEGADGTIYELTSISNSNELMLEAFTNNNAITGMVDYYFPNNSTFDILAVLNNLPIINDSHSVLKDSMNLDKIGAFGHSIGGAAVCNAALINSLIDSVLIYDSYIFHVVDKDAQPLDIPTLFIDVEGFDYTQEEKIEVDLNNEEVLGYLNKSEQNEHLTLNGASHMSFLTDILIGLNNDTKAQDEMLINNISSSKMIESIIKPTIDFFDSVLK